MVDRWQFIPHMKAQITIRQFKCDTSILLLYSVKTKWSLTSCSLLFLSERKWYREAFNVHKHLCSTAFYMYYNLIHKIFKQKLDLSNKNRYYNHIIVLHSIFYHLGWHYLKSKPSGWWETMQGDAASQLVKSFKEFVGYKFQGVVVLFTRQPSWIERKYTSASRGG